MMYNYTQVTSFFTTNGSLRFQLMQAHKGAFRIPSLWSLPCVTGKEERAQSQRKAPWAASCWAKASSYMKGQQKLSKWRSHPHHAQCHTSAERCELSLPSGGGGQKCSHRIWKVCTSARFLSSGAGERPRGATVSNGLTALLCSQNATNHVPPVGVGGQLTVIHQTL